MGARRSHPRRAGKASSTQDRFDYQVTTTARNTPEEGLRIVSRASA